MPSNINKRTVDKKVFLTVYCQGGLGNQLFQFIIGYILAKKNKINLRINIASFNTDHRQFELDRFPEISKLNIPKIKYHNHFAKIYFYLYPKFLKILKILKVYKFVNYLFFLEKNEKYSTTPSIEFASKKGKSPSKSVLQLNSFRKLNRLNMQQYGLLILDFN